MKAFMDQDFLLETETAKMLYHDYAAKMPVLDYHCHISPQEIAEDRQFENITQVWLGGDHYKWRQMRSNGIEERYITGDASDREKFQKWAETLERAIGNPLYHWSHLELQRYFCLLYTSMTVRNLVNWVQFMLKEMDIPLSISQMGKISKEEYFAEIERMAEAALADGCTATNPRVPSKADVMKIYESLW